jgi:succinyl-CoA synthetase beta subunit
VRLRREVTFVTAERAARPAEAVRIADAIGYPVVLKGMAPNAVHKTELGLVRLGLSTGAEVSSAFEELDRILAANASTLGQGWIEIQPMVPSGIELLVAARRDPVFGPVVVVGAGGKLVELIADTALRLGVVTETDAGEMLSETRIGTLLQGYRDGVGYDIAAAKAAIAALSRIIAEAGPEVKAIEINPLIVMPEGGGAVAVDLVIE